MNVQVTGRTKDGNFQVGVRRTFPVSVKEAWDHLLCQKGLKIWLGLTDVEKFQVKSPFVTPDGVRSMITTLNPYVNLRMQYQAERWTSSSILQVRVIDASGKATVSFHQEKLPDQESRIKMKQHWSSVLDRLEKDFKQKLISGKYLPDDQL